MLTICIFCVRLSLRYLSLRDLHSHLYHATVPCFKNYRLVVSKVAVKLSTPPSEIFTRTGVYADFFFWLEVGQLGARLRWWYFLVVLDMLSLKLCQQCNNTVDQCVSIRQLSTVVTIFCRHAPAPVSPSLNYTPLYLNSLNLYTSSENKRATNLPLLKPLTSMNISSSEHCKKPLNFLAWILMDNCGTSICPTLLHSIHCYRNIWL